MTGRAPIPAPDVMALVQRASAYAAEAMEDRNDAICRAHEAGETVREIAYWARLSPARVHQIIHSR